MAAADVQQPPADTAMTEPAPAIPDYLASPNAVFNDRGVQWRYGKAPDYSKTRKVWEEGKKMNHVAGSLPQLVENLVKNWEVEASFKPRLQDWRTIDHANYSFAINGGPGQDGEHMLKVGTYNAIIAPNEYYSPENSDFASSHKTFKRMMPTFAWEVIEVYSGPPKVSFKWRHWGVMKNDYVGFNDKGEKVSAKAHGGPIEIFGVTVADVDDSVRLQNVDTWFDPLEMFRQIAPHGVVKREQMNRNVDMSTAMDVGPDDKPEQPKSEAPAGPTNGEEQAQSSADPAVPSNDGIKIAEEYNKQNGEHASIPAPEEVVGGKHISNGTGEPADAFVPHQGTDTGKSVAETNNSEPSPAQAVVDTAATNGTAAEIEKPESNFHDAHENQPETVSGANEQGPMAEEKKVEQLSTVGDSPDVPRSIYSSAVNGNEEDVLKAAQTGDFQDESRTIRDAVDDHLESSADQVHPHRKDAEEAVQPQPGEAVTASADSEETRATHEEMSRITAGECPFLMNRE